MALHNLNSPETLFVQIYDELKVRARRHLMRERNCNTLQPTALVHEVYVRLIRNTRMAWQGKTHMLAMASIEMRRLLVDQARAVGASKRRAATYRVTLEDVHAVADGPSWEVLAIDEALDRLAERNERQGRVAEMRLFMGMTDREIADVLDVCERTVRGDWHFGRVWLKRHITTSNADDA